MLASHRPLSRTLDHEDRRPELIAKGDNASAGMYRDCEDHISVNSSHHATTAVEIPSLGLDTVTILRPWGTRAASGAIAANDPAWHIPSL